MATPASTEKLDVVCNELRRNYNPARTHQLTQEFWGAAAQWFSESNAATVRISGSETVTPL